ARSTHVGGVAAGCDLKFHHRIRRRTEILRVKCRIRIGRAIQQEEIGIRTRAPNHDGRSLSRTPIQRIRTSGPRTAPHLLPAPARRPPRAHPARPAPGRPPPAHSTPVPGSTPARPLPPRPRGSTAGCPPPRSPQLPPSRPPPSTKHRPPVFVHPPRAAAAQ